MPVSDGEQRILYGRCTAGIAPEQLVELRARFGSRETHSPWPHGHVAGKTQGNPGGGTWIEPPPPAAPVVARLQAAGRHTPPPGPVCRSGIWARGRLARRFRHRVRPSADIIRAWCAREPPAAGPGLGARRWHRRFRGDHRPFSCRGAGRTAAWIRTVMTAERGAPSSQIYLDLLALPRAGWAKQWGGRQGHLERRDRRRRPPAAHHAFAGAFGTEGRPSGRGRRRCCCRRPASSTPSTCRWWPNSSAAAGWDVVAASTRVRRPGGLVRDQVVRRVVGISAARKGGSTGEIGIAAVRQASRNQTIGVMVGVRSSQPADPRVAVGPDATAPTAGARRRWPSVSERADDCDRTTPRVRVALQSAGTINAVPTAERRVSR